MFFPRRKRWGTRHCVEGMEDNEKSLHEVTKIIQELIPDPQSERVMCRENIESIIKMAKARKPGYREKAISLVESLMKEFELAVAGMRDKDAAAKIYEYIWGLDAVENIYNLPHVDELRVVAPDKVYYTEKGRNKKADVCLKDDERIFKVITRILEHDRASLDESNPGCESRLFDGARLTALGPPIVKSHCFVLRKHGTFDISEENYIKSGTMDRYILSLFQLLVKGRANILICGDAHTGKTTLLRFLVGYLHERLNIITLETDRELLLDEWYPDRNVISIEAHPEIGWDMRRCFATILRLSPNVIIVGEARGLGEAGQMINTCRSGHHGSMGTIHTYSVYEALSVLAQMALEEGRRLPISVLENQVAAAFDIIVQMYGNSITGTKKVEHIVEVQSSKEGPQFRNLCVWKPSGDEYEKGRWEYPNGISEKLASKLFRYGVSRAEIDRIERMRVDARQ